MLDRLERRGLIERTPHPDDRRSVLVALTTDGQSAAARVAAAFAHLEARLPAGEIRRVLAAVAAAPH